MMIILICVVGVVLLFLNICLLCCCIRRHKRRKLQEKAASARLMEGPGRPVPMYGGSESNHHPHPHHHAGLRPDSQFSERDHGRGFSEFSEDEQSLRTIIELDGSNGGFHKQERISPGTYQTYLVDDPCAALMPSEYADVVTGANYAECLRANSLQRRLAQGPPPDYQMGARKGSGPPPLYPSSGDPMEDSLPPPMGPLRTLSQELNQYAPYYSPARNGSLLRRYSPVGEVGGDVGSGSVQSPGASVPTAVVQGITPYAEVRPIVTSNSHHGSSNGTLLGNNNSLPRQNGSPVLSTFSGGQPKKQIPPPDYLDMEQLGGGDLV